MICGERSRTKKAVLFDIDGTILNSYEFVFEAVKFSVVSHGLSFPDKGKVKKAMGKELVEFYKVLLPGTDFLSLSESHKQFQKGNEHLIKSFPKTKDTLKALKKANFAIGAVSNRIRKSLLQSFKLMKISQYFDVVVGADDVKNPKPHKEHVLVALRALEVKPEDAFMVGDTDHDILAGKSAKVKTIGVTYGWLGEDIKKYKPDFLVDDIEEVVNIVKKLSKLK